MNTTTKRVIWDVFLVFITALITFLVTRSMTLLMLVEPIEVAPQATAQPEVIEKTVEVTKLVVITATPLPATATPTPTPTPAATLGPISTHASLICFTGDVEATQLEQYLAGQTALPAGAEEAQLLDSGYIFMGYIPSGGYKFCAFSYELNRGGGAGMALALYNYGADEPYETHTLQPSSLEPQRVYALVSHSLVVNPNGRWVGSAHLINLTGGIALVDRLSIAGNKTRSGGGGGDDGGGGGGGYPSSGYP